MTKKRATQAPGGLPRLTMMTWRVHAYHIHETIHKKWAAYSDEDRRYNALSFAGEVGEVLNLLKKDWRGDPGDRAPDLADELADCRIYLELLAKCVRATLPRLEEEQHPDAKDVTPDDVRCAALRLMKLTGDLCAGVYLQWTGKLMGQLGGVIPNVHRVLVELAWLCNVNLDRACAAKIGTLYERWPEAKAGVQ